MNLTTRIAISRKWYTQVIIYIFFSTTSIGQSLFFNNLKETIWTSNPLSSQIELFNSTQIHLSESAVPKDSLKHNISIWTFHDSILTIMNYNCTQKSDSLIGKYNFIHLIGTDILQINFSDVLPINYKVGITSTGNHVRLFRMGDKKAKFITKIDVHDATKDGIYLKGYVVNITYEKIQRLQGEIVQVKGKVTIVKAVKNDDGIVRQGRNVDTRHLLNPKIKIANKLKTLQ